VLEETVNRAIESEKKAALDITLADFDGVQYHVATNPQERNIMTVSVSWRCLQEMKRYGVDQKLRQIYGNMVIQPEVGYDVSLQFDLDAVPADKRASLPHEISQLKRNIFASVFHHVFDSVVAGQNPGLVTINYRDYEAMYLKPEGDRVTIVFSINFKDKDDIVLSHVFLQELSNVRKTINNAPGILFCEKEAPLEIRGVPGVREGEDQGFVNIALFRGHMTEPTRTKVIDTVQVFRNYLHYHIKCSKAYLHTRMRLRVEELLLVLNRAKTKNADKEKKTAQGKTFKRG